MNYYYSTDGSSVIGPHSLDELSELHKSGALPQTTQVCPEGEQAWQPLSAILSSERGVPSADDSSSEREHADFMSDLQKHGGQIEAETEGKKGTATPPPTPQQRNAWYYSQEGTRFGPINEDQIRKLIAAHTIRPDSLVWCEGLADWTPAHQTDIRHLLGSATTPPPLPGESVNNGIVWTVALAPIIATLLQDILAAATVHPRSEFWWVALPLNIGLCLADQRKLKNAGHNTDGMTMWALLLVPVYLFVRASRLKQNNSYALVWLATFFISLFIYYPSHSSSGTSSITDQPTGRTQENLQAPPTAPPSTISEDIKVVGGMRETADGKVIVGYVHNSGTRTYGWVQVSFNLYHHQEQVGTTFADVFNLEPGKSQDFHVPLTEVSQSDVDDFKLMGVREPLGPNYHP